MTEDETMVHPADEVLARAEAAQALIDCGEAAKLRAAADWAEFHAEVPDKSVALPGAEQLLRLGGEGTPPVAEFCPAELGAVLRISTHAARSLIADALDLRHRLPRLWALVEAGKMHAWIGRKAAQATTDQPIEVAQVVDARAARWADGIGWGRLQAIIEAAVIEADPVAAQAEADRKATETGVWLRPSNDHGVKDIHIRALAADAIWLDSTLDRLADAMASLGADQPKQVLRARAVGVLAQPQAALDLIGTAQSLATGEAAPEPTPRTVDTRPKATLYVHLTDSALATGQGVARVEGEGPLTVDQVREWLGHCAVTIRPVIDLNDQASVDAYEVPDRLRDAVHLITPTDCFPHATGQSRRMDLDHTEPWIPHGPPGQTRIGNLGPMTRRHHRLKTHGGWNVRQPWPGVYVWRSPRHRHYLVDHTGTHPLQTGPPPAA